MSFAIRERRLTGTLAGTRPPAAREPGIDGCFEPCADQTCVPASVTVATMDVPPPAAALGADTSAHPTTHFPRPTPPPGQGSVPLDLSTLIDSPVGHQVS
jgi:hypothetical protein